MDDAANMALRKFLKQVGVTSQQAIEAALRDAGDAAKGREFTARVVLTIDGLDLAHTVEGRIMGPAE